MVRARRVVVDERPRATREARRAPRRAPREEEQEPTPGRRRRAKANRPEGGRRGIRALFSSLALIIIALAIGLLLAIGLGAAIWLIADALHHAANS